MQSKMLNTYYNVARFTIWGDTETTDDSNTKRPNLILGYRDGNPRFVVNTGAPGVEGMINYPMDNITLVSILNYLKDIANGEPGRKVSIDSLTTHYENNQSTNQKKVVSTLYIGKSKEGIVYLSILAEGKPKVVFSIKPSPWHVFKDGDKNAIPDSDVSVKLALGIADTLLNVVSMNILNYTNEEYESGTRKPTPINKPINNSKKVDTVNSLDDLDLDL